MALRLVDYCTVFKSSDLLADTGKKYKDKKEGINYNIGHTHSRYDEGK